ncbi:MAG TPA: hypothetical protein VMH83_01200 [Candidatus Acidoferrum sp.]|nr:hypothetical protein [Candidatus Acidoferrum sp.]
MIWHICKKDLRLLWPYAAMLALLYAAKAALSVKIAFAPTPESLGAFAVVLPIIVIAGMVALIAAAFYQDGLFSSTLDWRIRPIPRRDLLLAKMLFVVLAVQAPVFVIDLAEGLVDGLPFTPSLINALSDGFYKLCLLSLPAAMLASMTDRPLSLLAAAIFVTFGLLVPYLVIPGFGAASSPLLQSGVAWLLFMLWALTSIVAAAVILPLQYFKRATVASFAVFMSAIAVVGATWYLPWEAGFAVQRVFASQPGLAAPVTVSYAPDNARRLDRPSYPIPKVAESDKSPIDVRLPLDIGGGPADSMLFTDHASVRLLDANGQIIATNDPKHARDTESSLYFQFPLTSFASNSTFPAGYGPFLAIPPKLYLQYKQQPLRVEIDLSLSLLQQRSTVTMPALATGIHKEAGFACENHILEGTDTVRLNCLTASKLPSCSHATLSHSGLAEFNYSFPLCAPNYAPLGFTPTSQLINHVIGTIPFNGKHSHNGLLVDENKLADWNIVLQTYEAQDHFTRQLVIPEFKMGDWSVAE